MPHLVPTSSRQLVPQEPTVDYFQAVQGLSGPLRAFKDGSLGKASQHVGQIMFSTTPVVAAARAMKARKLAMNGLGQSDYALPAIGVGVFVGLMVVTGVLSYQAGKAMAPNRSKATSWGWIGVPVGMLTGPWGLGVMGIVSNSERK